MFTDPDGLSADARRCLVRLAALYMAQHIAECAQIFAAKLRNSPSDISAPEAMMAFALKVREIGSTDVELFLVPAPANGGAAGNLH
jgi:hypothetical protein